MHHPLSTLSASYASKNPSNKRYLKNYSTNVELFLPFRKIHHQNSLDIINHAPGGEGAIRPDHITRLSSGMMQSRQVGLCALYIWGIKMQLLPQRLATKIPVIMILSVTVLVALLVTVASWTGGNTSIKLTETSLQNAAQGRTNTVSLFLDQLQTKMRDLASHTNLADAATELYGGWRVLKDEAPSKLKKLYITDNPHAPHERHKHLDAGAKGVYYSTAHKKHQERIANLLEGGMFKDVIFVGKDGGIFYSFRKTDEFARNIKDKDIIHEELLAQIQPIVKIALEDPEAKVKGSGFTGFIKHKGEITAYMVSPLIKWNSTLGAIAFQVNTDKLAAIMKERAGLGETGKVDLISADLQNVSFSQNTVKDLPGSMLAMATKALKGEAASGIVEVKSDKYLAIAVPMKVLGTQWAVLASQNYSELIAPANNLRNSLLLIGLICLLAIGGLGGWFVRSSLAPLQKLNIGVMEIAQENFAVDLPDASRKDEVGELSRSVEILRNNALERRRLEKESQQEQQQRAKRQQAIEDMIDRFRSSS